MSSSRWTEVDAIVILLVVAMGAFAFVLAPSQQSHYSEVASTREQQEDGNAARQPQSGATTSPVVLQLQTRSSNAEPASGSDECDRDCQRDERDLEAQIEMADAAWAMFYVSSLGLVVGVITLFWIWRTVEHTKAAAISARESVVQAKLATAAAQEAAAQSARLGTAQLRAYLVPEMSMYHVNGEGMGTPNKLRGPLTVVNKGNSFALDVQPEVDVIVRANGVESELVRCDFEGDKTAAAIGSGEPKQFPIIGDHAVFRDFTYPPGGTAPWTTEPIIVTRVRLKYRDVFDEVHQSEAWFETSIANVMFQQVRRIPNRTERTENDRSA